MTDQDQTQAEAPPDVEPDSGTDDTALERQACLEVCRQVLLAGPIPFSLVGAYEDIRRRIESGQHRQAGPGREGVT